MNGGRAIRTTPSRLTTGTKELLSQYTFKAKYRLYTQLLANASLLLNFSLRRNEPPMAVHRGERKVRTIESESDRYCRA